MDEEDICGLCGLGGADKIPHPIHWPALSAEQRSAFLKSI